MFLFNHLLGAEVPGGAPLTELVLKAPVVVMFDVNVNPIFILFIYTALEKSDLLVCTYVQPQLHPVRDQD